MADSQQDGTSNVEKVTLKQLSEMCSMEEIPYRGFETK
jgi:hypothetical protein